MNKGRTKRAGLVKLRNIFTKQKNIKIPEKPVQILNEFGEVIKIIKNN